MENNAAQSPFAMVRHMWATSPLEIIIPGAIGMAAAQFVTVAFALHSSHTYILGLCLLAAAYALGKTCFFLYRLSVDQGFEHKTLIHHRDLWEMFGPLLASVVLYAIIAPNAKLEFFYAFITLPHFLFLTYCAKTFATIETDAHDMPRVKKAAAFVSLRASLVFNRAFVFVKSFRKTPDFSRS